MKLSNNMALLFLRLASGLMMLPHGIGKLKRFSTFPDVKFADPLGLGPALSLILIVFAEVVCSLFLIAGYKTKWAAVPLILAMLVIVFVVHWNDPFSRQELPLLYLAVYIALFISGSGRWSLDNWLAKK